ncbi:hypothetical protein SEPCBS57363_000080 [Sporothrix epigloea]|uniref:BTB domain-containing protein n=1 Tax=Sporothrix epigloea TaxID=1892477 RepID=A0ABP0D2Q9_9PEZI
MPPTANKPAPLQPAGRHHNARPTIVPVIPLPLVRKQQQQRQLKQQQLELEKKQREEKERKEREEKEREEQQLKEKEEQLAARDAVSKEVNDTPTGDGERKSAEASAAGPAPSDNNSALSPSAASQTIHETATTIPSSLTEVPQSYTNSPSADTSATPIVPPTAVDGRTPDLIGQPHIPTGSALNGLPQNVHQAPDYTFPIHSRSGSLARHRGPPRHSVNPQVPQYPVQNQHHPHPSFHQTHPSAGSLTYGPLHDSSNGSPGPTSHGSLPLTPATMGGPQFIPYNVQNMVGPNDWHQAPPGALHVGDLNANGFVPPSVGFNSSTPGSFHGSHSPDIAVDGPGFQHQGGPYPVPSAPNGHLPLRNIDSASMMSPPFYHLNGFPDTGPHGRRGGRNGINAPGIDFRFVHHLQHYLQHSYDNPQTIDCHLVLHFPHAKTATASESKTPDQQSVPTTIFSGHRSVLVQSYSIGELLRYDTGVMHNGPFNQPIHTLRMKIDDPYMSIEAANQALRSLYGHALADPTADGALAPTQSIDKALANFAAGFIFMLNHVESVAVQQAERLLGWDVVEKVLAFCLNGATFSNTAGVESETDRPAFIPARLRYARGTGAAVRSLLDRTIAFVVHHAPADFTFDSKASALNSTTTLATLLRFPIDTWSLSAKPTTFDGNSSIDGTAHIRSTGSVSLPMRKTSGSIDTKQTCVRSPKILFGDFAPRIDESTGPAQLTNGFVKKSPGDILAGAAITDTSTVLSRILLNLPFGTLKHILCQPQVTLLRTSFSRAIVDERERRRLQALDGIHAGVFLENSEQRNLVLGHIQQSTPPTQSNMPFPFEEWDVLGWKEVYEEDGQLECVWVGAETSR